MIRYYTHNKVDRFCTAKQNYQLRRYEPKGGRRHQWVSAGEDYFGGRYWTNSRQRISQIQGDK